jgi:hypothetical protein
MHIKRILTSGNCCLPNTTRWQSAVCSPPLATPGNQSCSHYHSSSSVSWHGPPTFRALPHSKPSHIQGPPTFKALPHSGPSHNSGPSHIQDPPTFRALLPLPLRPTAHIQYTALVGLKWRFSLSHFHIFAKIACKTIRRWKKIRENEHFWLFLKFITKNLNLQYVEQSENFWKNIEWHEIFEDFRKNICFPEPFSLLSDISWKVLRTKSSFSKMFAKIFTQICTSVKVCPPAHNYEHEAGSYGDGFT